MPITKFVNKEIERVIESQGFRHGPYVESRKLIDAEKEMKISRNILERVGDKKQLAMIGYELGLISKAKNKNEESYKQLQDALSAFQRMSMKT